MPQAYATRADAKAYSSILNALGDAAVDALLEDAAKDIDSIAATRPVLESGYRFDPTDLLASEVTALSRATSAQAEYRSTMGPEFFVRPQYPKVNGPDFSHEGALPYIGPRVWRELAGSGLVRLSTTTANTRQDPPWLGFTHNIEEDPDQ